MSQFNLGSLNSTGNAILVVNAGDPETLILNHSTKNTVYIGESNAVGSGNLLDATPLDPYASIVVTGVADVWAVAADQTKPATVYTYKNAINWSPKAIQPNIIDPNSPLLVLGGTHNFDLQVPLGAQGLFLAFSNNTATQVFVRGDQSQVFYLEPTSPAGTGIDKFWVPILSDADTSVSVSVTAPVAGSVSVEAIWLMQNYIAGLVQSGQSANVNIASITPGVTGTLPVSVTGQPIGVNLTQIGGTATGAGFIQTLETSKQAFANQQPLPFNLSIAAGATANLLPASVGVSYALHNFYVQINSGDMMSCHVQDTGGNDLGVFINLVAGVPANAYRPPNPPFDFRGAILPTGVGVQIKNGGAALEAFVGTLTYSK